MDFEFDLTFKIDFYNKRGQIVNWMSLLFTNMYNAEKEIESKRLIYVVNYLKALVSPFRVKGICLSNYDGK